MPATPFLVLTPTLGRSPYLDETVEDVRSLAARVRLRHVVVAPEAECGALRSRWPDVTVLAEDSGRGIYGALNFAAAAFDDWQWLTWINDDDRLRPEFAEACARATSGGNGPDVWYGEVEYLSAEGGGLALLPVCRRTAEVPALLAAGVAPFTQQGALIRRDLWRRLGGFDPALRIAGDFDLWVRAAATGARFGFVPRPVAAFRIRAGQLSGEVSAAQREVREILARRELGIGAGRRSWALLRFRMRNLPRILGRVLRTGRVRSRGLFAR